MAESVSVWVATGAVTPRHQYVAYIIFDVVIGCSFHWFESHLQWEQSDGLKIQYGGEQQTDIDAVWIPACGLLEGKELDHPARRTWSDAAGLGVPGIGRLPFGVANSTADRIDADWWSWVFWMVTRLEEYHDSDNAYDSMGRFQGRASMAYQEDWLKRPEVEVRIRAWASSVFLRPTPLTYKVNPTIDVDSAFAYRHRSVMRTVGSTLKDLSAGSTVLLAERFRVLIFGEPDPYDTYNWLESIHEAFSLRARYFFLLADRGPYDKPVDWRQPGMKALVQRLTQSSSTGIHPSVASHSASNVDRLKMEIRRLERVSRTAVNHSRQHYLLQRIPETWRRLEEVGIEHDYSLVYADRIGFRAGMSRSFRAFDAVANRPLKLTIHPVAAMDATLNRYMGLSPEQALDTLENLANEVKDVQGELTLLWHNETVSECNEWRGWRSVYEQVFNRVC